MKNSNRATQSVSLCDDKIDFSAKSFHDNNRTIVIGHSVQLNTGLVRSMASPAPIFVSTKSVAMDYSNSIGTWLTEQTLAKAKTRVGYSEKARAEFNREQVANCSIDYTECYQETFDEDIFNHLEAVQYNEDEMGAECELLALVEFG